jgi:hypothetical protein
VKVYDLNGLKWFTLEDLEKHSLLEQDVLLKSYKFLLKPSLTIDEEDDGDFDAAPIIFHDPEVNLEDLPYLNVYDV